MAPTRPDYSLAGDLGLAAPTPIASRLDPSASAGDEPRDTGMVGICLNPH